LESCAGFLSAPGGWPWSPLELDPDIARHTSVARPHSPLHRDATADGVHHTAKLDQYSIAGRLDDATVVFGDLGVDQLVPMCFQPFRRAFLVSAHQARVTRDIGDEDSGELAFDLGRGCLP